MKGILFRWLVLTASILLTAYLIDGIRISGFWPALFAAVILGILNAFLRPVIILLTLPINILTFGLFTFIINAVLLMMAAAVISGFEVAGFWSAVGGAIIISLVSWVLGAFITEQGTVGVIDLKQNQNGRWE